VKTLYTVLFLLAVNVASALAPAEAQAQHLTDAELARWTSHILSLERRVARSSDDAALMTRLANAYVQVGDLRRALPALEQLASMGVSPVLIDLFRGDVYFNTGELDSAARAYLRVLTRAPQQAHALSQLWRLMLRVTLTNAEVGFDRDAVVETLQNAGLYFPEAYTPTEEGPQEASRLVDQANTLIPRDRPEEAIVALTRAISLDPGNAAAFAALARSYTALNDFESAVGASLVYLLLAPDASDAPRVRRSIGQVLERTYLR
jgi:tetratricopeptide (TPR) repeat protein